MRYKQFTSAPWTPRSKIEHRSERHYRESCSRSRRRIAANYARQVRPSLSEKIRRPRFSRSIFPVAGFRRFEIRARLSPERRRLGLEITSWTDASVWKHTWKEESRMRTRRMGKVGLRTREPSIMHVARPRCDRQINSMENGGTKGKKERWKSENVRRRRGELARLYTGPPRMSGSLFPDFAIYSARARAVLQLVACARKFFSVTQEFNALPRISVEHPRSRLRRLPERYGRRANVLYVVFGN